MYKASSNNILFLSSFDIIIKRVIILGNAAGYAGVTLSLVYINLKSVIVNIIIFILWWIRFKNTTNPYTKSTIVTSFIHKYK